MSDWRDAVRPVLAKLGKVREHSTCDFGREENPACMSTVIAGGEPMVADSAVEALERVRKTLPPGFVAWLGTTRWLGSEKNVGMVELCVGPGADQYDMLRHAKSDAVNFGLETEDLITKLKAFDAKWGIAIFHAETDTIELNITRPIADPAELADALYEFCPDIVDQGVGSVEELAALLEESPRVYLWWD